MRLSPSGGSLGSLPMGQKDIKEQKILKLYLSSGEAALVDRVDGVDLVDGNRRSTRVHPGH